VTNKITEGGDFSNAIIQTDNFFDEKLKKLLIDL